MKIKMSPRLARRLLTDHACRIRVKKAHSEFVTQGGITFADEVFVPKEQIYVPLADITAIEVKDRFGAVSMTEVDWR